MPGGGAVILMASIAGLRGNRMLGTYALTKAAIAQLARNLAVEWGAAGVRANAIAPGLIDTDFAAPLKAIPSLWPVALARRFGPSLWPVALARRLARTPLGRMGRTEAVAGTAVWLAAPAGAFVTGQTIVVDGGTLIGD